MTTQFEQGASQSRVAVLMCVHRGADAGQFDEALQSMRVQTHPDLCIYLYCDGPLNPAQEEVIAGRLDISSGRDKIVRGERPAGLPTGLNALIELALIDPGVMFMARMDADDIAMPERIARQLEFLDTHADVSIVGTWCIEFSEPGVPLFNKQLPSDPKDVPRSMLLRNALAHPTVMFRRRVFERGNRYDPRLLVMQDYEFWSRLIVAGEIISNVPEYLLWFRIGEGFLSRRHGVRRAWDEVGLRLRFARASGQFRLVQVFGLSALFLVRVLPPAVKRLAYKHLR